MQAAQDMHHKQPPAMCDTDIDDKIIARAKLSGEDPLELSRR